jgi:hypothetical protein
VAAAVRARKPAAWYRIHDADQMVGVVRCELGAYVTWAELVTQLLDDLGYREKDVDPADQVKPPVWRWYRMNPCPSGEYAWTLGYATGPGRGNWQGAAVELL